MPLFRLSDRIEFPPAWLARLDGLLCIGGDLRPERIIEAYRNGIFPWFSKDEPLLWWSPDPRLVLFPDEINISKSLRKKLRKQYFHVTMDQAFDRVIRGCADSRTSRGGDTWLVDEMIEAYSALHRQGYAHSVETWHGQDLAGGLYGLSLGKVFFGESMFARVTDASKVALASLCLHLESLGFDMVDCQVTTDHLLSMGAVEMPRYQFLSLLNDSLKYPDSKGPWSFDDTSLSNRQTVDTFLTK